MGQVLVARYGQHQWILQVMEMVVASVDGGIKQLTGTPGPAQNAQSFTQVDPNHYAMGARTAQEVKVAPAAHSGHIPAVQPSQVPQAQQAQAAMQAGQVDMFAQLSQIADPALQQLGQPIPGQPMPPPTQPPIQTPGGLILPPGQGQPDAGPVSGDDDDPLFFL